jgi:hypothetical protein
MMGNYHVRFGYDSFDNPNISDLPDLQLAPVGGVWRAPSTECASQMIVDREKGSTVSLTYK